MHGTNVKITDT